ncbi:hypothetical protein [Streptomyces sp. NBC_00859]|uniref:hypothetical protein n=1 Tax=Streptomyces sp. NBC_00859 TaxID=2903682 RepID=UPI00386CF258|nr:hypothetical protein OG584_10165 [Streptomyces sp. NBC_00859]
MNRRTAVGALAVVAGLGIGLVGCSGGSDGGSSKPSAAAVASGPSDPVSPKALAPGAAAKVSLKDPAAIAAALRDQGYPLRVKASYTKADYPPSMRYPLDTSPARGLKFTDPAVHGFTTGNDNPLDGSAMIDVYAEHSGAQRAQDERTGFANGDPSFKEFDFVNGPALLRIAGKLTTDQAESYCRAFTGLGRTGTKGASSPSATPSADDVSGCDFHLRVPRH